VARFRRGFRGGSRPVRGVEWCGWNQPTVATVTSNAGEKVICSYADLRKYTDPTIMRIRGDLWFAQGYDETAGSEQQTARGTTIACGIIPVASELGAGTGPDPLDPLDMVKDWMWLKMVSVKVERIPVAQQTSGTTSSNAFIVAPIDANSLVHVIVDIKAKRKMKSGEELRLLYRGVNSAAPGLEAYDCYMTGSLRILIKE